MKRIIVAMAERMGERTPSQKPTNRTTHSRQIWISSIDQVGESVLLPMRYINLPKDAIPVTVRRDYALERR